MKPNPDQLAHIPSNPHRRDNPALYSPIRQEYETGPVPTVVIGPNAAYIVDPGYSPGSNLPEGATPAPPVEEVQAPVLTSIDPPQLPVWAEDQEVLLNGENFTQASVIIWNNGQEPATFVDANNLRTLVKPSTVQVAPPFPVEVYVKNGDKESAKVTFTFIA